MSWQPIESAPRDAPILVFAHGEVLVAKWNTFGNGWGVSAPVPEQGNSPRVAQPIGPYQFGGVEVWSGPTHWRPLPDPPQ